MKRLIYKIALKMESIGEPQHIWVPLDAEILSAAYQEDIGIVVWYSFNSAIRIKRYINFWLVFTGSEVDFKNTNPKFLGTVQTPQRLVYHIYYEDVRDSNVIGET